jgi:type I restriction enzyme S subunit
MRKYQTYKPSRVLWINEYPSHWTEKQNKHIFCEKKDEVGIDWKDYQLLSLSKKGIIKRDIDSGKGKFPESFESYKKVESDDLIFCLYDIEETPRSVGLSKFNGMITGSYKIYRCTENPKFIYYWYLTIDDFKGLKPFYTGMRNVVRPETFLSLKIYIPPINEQNQIVQFLDEKTELIDKLISTKELKISLLKEQRTLLINQVVTKGLNPNVKMKESGVEWIGKIPEHWKVGKLYQYSKLLSGSTPLRTNPEYWEDGDIPWMSSGEINKEIIRNIDGRITKLGNEKSNTPMLPVKTVMIGLNGQGKTKGTVGILEVETTCNQSLCGIICNNFVEPFFLFYFLKSQYYHLRGLVGEGKREGLSVSFLSLYPLLIPSISEQQQIVKYLDSQTKEIDEIVFLEQKKIDLLKEYRQSLISEVVTGKIKVTTDE